MKKVLLLCLLACFCNFSAKAQLCVDYFGHTTVGDTQNTSALFNVNSTQSYVTNMVSFEPTNSAYALNVWNKTTSAITNGNAAGAVVFCDVYANRGNYGIQSYALTGDAINSGSAYGLLSKAGYAKNGYNYGICTSLLGPHDGAGIYASSGYYPDGFGLVGQWAGYFDGNVKVLGNLTATSLTQTSDYRLKENIRQLDNSSLDRLMDMNVIKYRIKNYEVKTGDTATTTHYAYNPDSPLLKTDHYGLIAQELKELYPELVVEGADGFLSVNYIELIPILIKSVQELKAKVDALENDPERSVIRDDKTTQASTIGLQAALYQNNPNPFTENTTVRCIIPNDITNAVMYIYNMNGNQIDSIVIPERGDVSVIIEGKRLVAGIYLYSLITDGEVIDTKRLILTQ